MNEHKLTIVIGGKVITTRGSAKRIKEEIERHQLHGTETRRIIQ